MATFECKIYELTIEPHNNADALELAVVGDYRSIVRKDTYESGMSGVYIPEGAVLPEWLISQLGLEGRLAGKAKNRVKAVKLRGVLSQGLIYPVLIDETSDGDTVFSVLHMREDGTLGYSLSLSRGDDVTELLGITKYEPVIPSCMDGEVFNAFGYTLKFDIENIKKFPNTIAEGTPVQITEKLHGTWACFGYHPEVGTIVTSKGLSDKGLTFKMDGDSNVSNLYVRTLREIDNQYDEPLLYRVSKLFEIGLPIYLLGEIFGRGVQDLHYGHQYPAFRLFDIYVGTPGEGQYIDAAKLDQFAKAIGLRTVPNLYEGPFSKEVVDNLTNGRETVSGTESNLREGIVIRPSTELRDPEIGRVILKSVSEKYLLRNNGTEFN